MKSNSPDILQLPFEILSDILSKAYDGRQYWRLAKLALVCRRFHAVVNPSLYSCVTVAGKNSKGKAGKSHMSLKEASLIRTLEENTALASYVRTWWQAQPEELPKPSKERLEPANFVLKLTGLREAVLPIYNPVVECIALHIEAYGALRKLDICAPAEAFNEWSSDMKLPLEELKVLVVLSVVRLPPEEVHQEWAGGKGYVTAYPYCGKEDLDAKEITARQQMSIQAFINLLLGVCPRLQSLDIKGSGALQAMRDRPQPGTFDREAALKDIPMLLSRPEIPESHPSNVPASLKHIGLYSIAEFFIAEALNMSIRTKTVKRREKNRRFREFVEALACSAPQLQSLGWSVSNFNNWFICIAHIRYNTGRVWENRECFLPRAIMPSLPQLRFLRLREATWLDVYGMEKGQRSLLPDFLSYLADTYPSLEELDLGTFFSYMENIYEFCRTELESPPSTVDTRRGLRFDRLKDLTISFRFTGHMRRYGDVRHFNNYNQWGVLSSEGFFKYFGMYVINLPLSLEKLKISAQMMGIPESDCESGLQAFYENGLADVFKGLSNLTSFTFDVFHNRQESKSYNYADEDEDDAACVLNTIAENGFVCRRCIEVIDSAHGNEVAVWWMKRCSEQLDHRFISALNTFNLTMPQGQNEKEESKGRLRNWCAGLSYSLYTAEEYDSMHYSDCKCEETSKAYWL